MTYESERTSVGRRPITLIKLYFDSGTVLLGTSDVNTLGDYDGEVIRPTIAPGSVRVTPSRINFLDTQKIGEVGKVSFVVIDEPETTGTFWGKLLAADPYYLNRKCELLTGYYGTGLNTANFETRSYLLEAIDGPDSKGRVTITAKHPLTELLDPKNVAPAATQTYLDGNITNSATTIDILPAGEIASWASTGKIRINGELISYAGKTGDQLTSCTRAQDGTEAVAHDDGDHVQLCLSFSNAALDTVIDDLMTDYTNVPAAYFDTAAWAAEVSAWLNADRLDRVISEPTPVATLIAEACTDSLALFFFNERTGKFVLQAIAPQLGTGYTVDETNNILQGSQSVKRDLTKLATRVLVYYDKINPVEDDRPANYRRAVLRIDADREGAAQWDTVKTLTHYSKWVAAAGASTVTKFASRMLTRFGDGLTTIKFALDAGDESDAWTGDRVYFNSRLIQDSTGAQPDTQIHIIEATEIDGHRREYVATLDVFSGGRYALITANSMANYTSASTADQAKYGWISNNTPEMTNGDDPYLII